ncbi:MAG: pseudouridine synthase [Lachnospiraceae bacterium]|nr:pseudouridine synthase [Lachnospiraceae bacterium]
MEKKKSRINKYIAEAGVCSRREADKLIEQGFVTINGSFAAAGDRVDEKDVVMVRGKRISAGQPKIVLAYYKKVGITCTERDLYAKKTVIQDLNYPVRVTYAGRLDKDSEGLLLMTNDGSLIQGLMRAANYHEKEYIVKVQEEITSDFIEAMSKPMYLPELEKTTRACKVEKLGKYTFSIILTQGMNRQIRRMCQELGFHVKRLKRIRIADVTLGNLKPGEYRRLTEEELEILHKRTGTKGEENESGKQN